MVGAIIINFVQTLPLCTHTHTHTHSFTPTQITVQSAGRLSETITDVRCGLDGSMFLTAMGRLYACGK